MHQLLEVDQNVTIRQQLSDPAADPVILINTFSVAAEDVDAMLAAWADDAHYFKGQPGFIATQLHRGTTGSTTFLNYATWETVGHFAQAFSNPVFQAKLAAYPESTRSAPHLYRPVAVSGICVA